MPYENPNGVGVDGTLQTSNVDGLRVVPKPVAKVGPLDQHRSPFLAVKKGDCLKHVFDICGFPLLVEFNDRANVLSGYGWWSWVSNLHGANCDLQPKRRLDASVCLRFPIAS